MPGYVFHADTINQSRYNWEMFAKKIIELPGCRHIAECVGLCLDGGNISIYLACFLISYNNSLVTPAKYFEIRWDISAMAQPVLKTSYCDCWG